MDEPEWHLHVCESPRGITAFWTSNCHSGSDYIIIFQTNDRSATDCYNYRQWIVIPA